MVAAVHDESTRLITSRTTADLRIRVHQLTEISSRERAHPLICLFKSQTQGKVFWLDIPDMPPTRSGMGLFGLHIRYICFGFLTDVLIGNESR